MYYLQSRYYDPYTGRFINADGIFDTGDGILSQNMFAYCQNNPVMFVDPTGMAAYCSLCGKPIGTNPWECTGNWMATTPKTNNSVIGANKSQNQRSDSGMKDLTDDEVTKKSKDKSLPPAERKKYQTEDKIRGNRNKQKRQSNITPTPEPYFLIGMALVVTGAGFVYGFNGSIGTSNGALSPAMFCGGSILVYDPNQEVVIWDISTDPI